MSVQDPVEAENAPRSSRRLRPPVLLAIIAGLLAAFVVVAVAVLVGTGDPAGQAENNPGASPSQSASPSAKPTVVPTGAPSSPPPTIDSLVLTEVGLGELRLGSDPAAADPARSLLRLESFECGYDQPVVGWVANYPEAEHRPFGVVHHAERGIIAIQVSDPRIFTDRGVRRGSTLEQVQAAYPELRPLHLQSYLQRWGFDTPSGTMTFDIWGGETGDAEVGPNAVSSIMITDAPSVDVLGQASYHPIGVSCL